MSDEAGRSKLESNFGIGISLAIRPILVYLFIFFLLQLGRSHIGIGFDLLFFVLLVLPILSVLHLVVSIASLKYHQEFDTEHPVKGERLTYTLLLANESYLPSVHIGIGFRTISPGGRGELPELSLTLKRGERAERRYEISCPYRGIYTVGLERLIMRDVLGMVSIARPVWHRTFYVYPRIIESDYPFDVGDVSELATGPNPGASQDYSLFETLVPYRQGAPIRHMAWKKYFALGEPFLKSYARTSQPGISIYFDLRRGVEADSAVLEREDCSVEILVALARNFLVREVPVSIHAIGQSRYSFSGMSPEAFERFHADTVNLLFTNTVSPAVLYRSDVQHTNLRTSVVFISHLLDPEILEIIEDSSDVISSPVSSDVAFILNAAGMRKAELDRAEKLFEDLEERGAQVVTVRNAGSIAEDLRSGS